MHTCDDDVRDVVQLLVTFTAHKHADYAFLQLLK